MGRQFLVLFDGLLKKIPEDCPSVTLHHSDSPRLTNLIRLQMIAEEITPKFARTIPDLEEPGLCKFSQWREKRQDQENTCGICGARFVPPFLLNNPLNPPGPTRRWEKSVLEQDISTPSRTEEGKSLSLHCNQPLNNKKKLP